MAMTITKPAIDLGIVTSMARRCWPFTATCWA